ncbi:MAG: hypothetical protein Q4A62_06055 [Eikenella sp.]|nr:hypothetical protein [Eikenella sp.]
MNFDMLQQPVFERAIIMGVTKFKGEIEGNTIDSCTVFKAAPFNDATGNALGLGLAKVRFGDSSNFDRFKGLSFPCELEIQLARVTNGSGKETVVIKDFRVPEGQKKG